MAYKAEHDLASMFPAGPHLLLLFTHFASLLSHAPMLATLIFLKYAKHTHSLEPIVPCCSPQTQNALLTNIFKAHFSLSGLYLSITFQWSQPWPSCYNCKSSTTNIQLPFLTYFCTELISLHNILYVTFIFYLPIQITTFLDVFFDLSPESWIGHGHSRCSAFL